MTDPLEKVRAICLALPGAHEQETWGHPTFRVGKKIFAGFGSHEGRASVTMKTGHEQQRMLTDDARRYFYPDYVGSKGWTGMYVDRRPPWKLVEALIVESYRAIAPKKLVRELDGGGKR